MKNEHLKILLKKAGFKVTSPRVAILELFGVKTCRPLDALAVYEKVKGRGIDLATVYRTLSAFEEAAILRRVDLHKDSTYFELSEDHHHHLVCNNCGKVVNFEENQIEKLVEKILKSSKFRNETSHSFEIFGLCRSCASV